MNKKIFTLSVLVLLFFIPKITFGFFDDPLSIDMYKKIDEANYKLETQFIDMELKGGDIGSVKKNFNNTLKSLYPNDKDLQKCFLKEISIENIKNLSDGNISILPNIISKDCQTSNGNLGSDTILKLVNTAKVTYNNSEKRALKKVKELNKISRIGMYSDGIEENSAFDLIVDLKNIDKIIFETPIEYKGINNGKLDKIISSILSGLTAKEANLSVINNNTGNTTNTIIPINTNCKLDNSGLNNSSVDLLLGNTPSSTNNGTGTPTLGGSSGTTPPNSAYKKVNDNNVWPCNNFFCIKINMVYTMNNLLSGGDDLSIEGLIKRSNNHLKKYANSFLGQSTMTNNFFQIGFRDLDFLSTFNFGVRLSFRPVPLLNIEQTDYIDNTKTKDALTNEFEVENLLKSYYKNLGLNYKRSNDLSILNKAEVDEANVYNSVGKSYTNIYHGNDDVESVIKSNNMDDHLGEFINKKLLIDDSDNFYSQFIELEIFTKQLLDYTVSTKNIFYNMNQTKTTK